MKKKILILDDKETIAKVVSIYLKDDYDVQWLSDGLQGVKCLQDGNIPDLIILDIRMPGMRGDDFLEWIKHDKQFRHIPVIMLSSEDSTSERIRLLETGAEDYIVKPFNPLELKIRVKKIIDLAAITNKGDGEVMLVGDDYVVSKSEFDQQKEDEANNGSVKPENDPKSTKEGFFKTILSYFK